MQLGIKSAVVIALGAIGIAVGAYMLGSKQADSVKPAVPAVAKPATDGLPANHPPTTPDGPPAQGAEGKAGIDRADPNAKFTHFNVGTNNVKALYIDDKVVWVGTSNGAIRYDTVSDQYRMYDTNNGLLSKGVFWLGKIDNKIAVGTYGGGLSLFDSAKESWENINIPDGLGDAFVYGALKANNGDVWIATWSGANLIKGGNLKDKSKWQTFTVKNTNGGLPNDWVYGLAQGKNGEIWLATEGGLARYKDGKWDHWNHSNGQGADIEKVKNDPQFTNDPATVSGHHAKQKEEMGLKGISVAYNPNYIIAMQVDKEGNVWCGTWGGGLARFDGKKFTNYTMSDGLPGNHIFMLHYDQDGILWVGTNNGISRYDGKKFTNYSTADGLFSNNVFSMATAADRTRWVGSFGGVARLTGLK